MTSHYFYNFEFVSNDNASYFDYSLQDPTVISRFVLDVSGQVRQLIWVPSADEWMIIWAEPHQLCDVYAVCGAFGVCDEKIQRAEEGDQELLGEARRRLLCVGEKQFRNEVRTIGRIQHVNLVRLRGFSSHGSERLLVYDYMPNGSLDRALFGGAAAPPTLSWSARFQIALGAARDLLYLHEGCRDCIIHCDMKPENILLDEDLVPKVADFGMAKLVGRDFSRVLTTVRGTIGYLAPEWISGVPITAKADVYSYGMVLLEIISGRRNAQCWVTTEHGASLSSEYFPLVTARNVSKGAALVALPDERLQGDADPRELGRPPRRIARRRRPSRLPRSRRDERCEGLNENYMLY
ncbi:unnamed protein product [Miscanthus lutarioriparius]|uniref:Protein kinase domain-containing protein n=1 Tax=Miscanthus lutarioriparius TaxID=422564 RepID=A0A811NV27_9POAL|nr:unnamed protein product [Miscanthus lutarioriparius]